MDGSSIQNNFAKFIVHSIYIFNRAFRQNEHYRMWKIQNKNLKSLFQNHNLTYFSKHLEYESHAISLKKKRYCQQFTGWYMYVNLY